MLWRSTVNKVFRTIPSFLVLFLAQSCATDDVTTSQEVEKAYLERQFGEIIGLATSTQCDATSGCRFLELGSKPCGGPRYYLIYRSNVDTTKLVDLVRLYNQSELFYNERWEIGSDCSMELPPDSVRCVGGDCVGYWDHEQRSVFGPPPHGW
jgi:hypothetical protein